MEINLTIHVQFLGFIVCSFLPTGYGRHFFSTGFLVFLIFASSTLLFFWHYCVIILNKQRIRNIYGDTDFNNILILLTLF